MEVAPGTALFCKRDAVGRALFVPWGPQEGQILRGGCPRQGTFLEDVAPGRALLCHWVLSRGRFCL